jgi:small-conductance mechanosensitive channel
MAHHILAMLIAGGVISGIHALGPDHWLPHVVVSRAQGWSLGKALRVTLLSAAGHVGLTVLLGLAIIYLFVEVEVMSEALTSSVIAVLLGVAAIIFILRGLRRKEHRHGRVMSDGAATVMLFLVATLPPCYAILPLFLAASVFGWTLALSLVLMFSLLTVAVMLTLVTLGRRSYDALKESGILRRLEEREDLIVGTVFALLAVSTLLGI